jgi:hypothetical protein
MIAAEIDALNAAGGLVEEKNDDLKKAHSAVQPQQKSAAASRSVGHEEMNTYVSLNNDNEDEGNSELTSDKNKVEVFD